MSDPNHWVLLRKKIFLSKKKPEKLDKNVAATIYII